MSKLLYCFICIALAYAGIADANVERVTIKWVSWQFAIGGCDANCGRLVEEQMRKVPGVAAATADVSAGQVTLEWQKGYPFNYYPLDFAMRLAGVGTEDVHVKVRGHIIHGRDTGLDKNTITLISSGDGTRFVLLGPIITSTNQYVIASNAASYAMPQEWREELLKAEADKREVTIEGLLMRPEMSPPIYLIIKSKEIAPPESKEKLPARH